MDERRVTSQTEKERLVKKRRGERHREEEDNSELKRKREMETKTYGGENEAHP
jgi:hypothetical protein